MKKSRKADRRRGRQDPGREGTSSGLPDRGAVDLQAYLKTMPNNLQPVEPVPAYLMTFSNCGSFAVPENFRERLIRAGYEPMYRFR